MRAALAATLLCLLSCPGFAAETAVRTITLVRHGHYAADPQADAKLGPGLSVLGVAQARIAAARLRAESASYDTIYASPLTRAQDTARLIVEAFPGAHIEDLAQLDDLALAAP